MTKGRDLLLATGVAAGAAAALAVMALAVGGGDDDDGDLLPDLDIAVPGKLSGRSGGTRDRPQFLLGFQSAAANVGDGPVTLLGSRRNVGEPTMKIVQQVARKDGSFRARPVRGGLRYVRSPDHAHWHYLGFMRYQLRRPDGSLVRPDRKTGFCLGDRYRYRVRVRGAASRPFFPDECGRGQPERLRMREGITVGYGDDYDPHLEGQELEVTGLPAGRYVLVHRVNPDRRLLESDYTDNVSSLALDLTWPRGPNLPPTVDVADRCPHSATCP